MSSWVSANMAAFLPPGTQEILDLIEDLTTVVNTPLELVADALDAAKIFLVSLPVFDYLGLLADLIQDFKESFLASGIFICDMWDYPIKQITSVSDFGPDNTYKTINLSGNLFEESFLRDLNASFDDTRDPNVPQFTGNVSMLVLLRGKVNIDDLTLSPEEESIAQIMKGMSPQINSAGKSLHDKRHKAMLGKFTDVAQAQPADKVAVRVERVTRVTQMFNQFTDEEKDAVEFPWAESLFYENKDFTEIDWQTEVVPYLKSIEDQFATSRYPDWNAVTLRDIHPDLVELVDSIFDPVIDLLQQGQTISNQLIEMIDAIRAKVDALQDLIDRIEQIIEDINNLLNATGYHALYISSTQGINDLRQKLLTATDVPFTSKSFYSGMAILAGSDAKVAFDALFAGVGSIA